MNTSALPTVPQAVRTTGARGIGLDLGRLGRAAGQAIATRLGRSRLSTAERRELWVQSLLMRLERALADIEREVSTSEPAQRARQGNLRAVAQLHEQLSGLASHTPRSRGSSEDGDVLHRAHALQMWLDDEERRRWEVSVLPADEQEPPGFHDTQPADDVACAGKTMAADEHRRMHVDLMLIMQAEKRRHRRRRSLRGATSRKTSRQTIGEPGPLVTSMIDLILLGWLVLKGDLRAAYRHARSLVSPVPQAPLQVRQALQGFVNRCDAATSDLIGLPAIRQGSVQADAERASRAQLLADVAGMRQQVQEMLDVVPVHGSTIKKVLPSGTAVMIRRGYLMLNVVDEVVTAARANHLREIDRDALAAAAKRGPAAWGSLSAPSWHDPANPGWASVPSVERRGF